MHVRVNPGVLVRASVSRLMVHAVAAWALTAVLLVILLSTVKPPLSAALYALGAPALTALLAAHHALHRPDAADPLTTAFGFTSIAAALDLLAGGLVQERLPLFDPALGLGLPLMLIFGSTGLTVELVSRARDAHSH